MILENARICYEEIRSKSYKKKGKVIILVGFDIDSLTSLRILVALLKSDGIQYEIIPIYNSISWKKKIEYFNPDLYNSNTNKQNNQPTCAFVLLKCVGTLDMSKYWFCEETMDILTQIIINI